MVFLALVFVAAIFSGSTAAIAGFGIGSLLTPLLAIQLDASTAVAAVSLPHAAATALRWWRLRQFVDGAVLRRFGVLSAGGGLVGALLYTRFSPRILTSILAVLLLATSTAALTNWSARWSPRGALVGWLGFASGMFGGLAGNQGGLRSAALLTFGLSPARYVATATAIALIVDAARTPVYVWRAGRALVEVLTPMSVATAGVLIGTLIGERLLLGLSPSRFRTIVGALIGVLGVWMLIQALRAPL